MSDSSHDPELRFGAATAPYDADPRVQRGTGFGGSLGLRVDGRIFAMLFRGMLVVKLPASRVSELLAARAARRFDAGKGRAMREWASVPASNPDPWPALVAEAYAFVGGSSASESNGG